MSTTIHQVKKIQLIHNPTAGQGDHSKEDIIAFLNGDPGKIEYVSTQEEAWEKDLIENPEVVVIGGGDGTVRGYVEVVRTGRYKLPPPTQIIPLGTANNIAKTLEIPLGLGSSFQYSTSREFEIGALTGFSESDFFLESFGFGIFPTLITKMEEREEQDPVEELDKSVTVLQDIVENYQAKEGIIEIDGKVSSGKYLLVEVMNIRYIGPNIPLAPNAEIDDGFFQLVSIPETSRPRLLNYLDKIRSKDLDPGEVYKFAQVQNVKKVTLQWKGTDAHVDDESVDYSGEKIQVELIPGAFQVLVNDLK